jgi:hypothetical protein
MLHEIDVRVEFEAPDNETAEKIVLDRVFGDTRTKSAAILRNDYFGIQQPDETTLRERD